MLNVGRYTAWWKWRPPRHRGALHTNELSSTASQAGENDHTNIMIATQRSFKAFSTYPELSAFVDGSRECMDRVYGYERPSVDVKLL
jgi:hypothetical protein